MLNYVPRKCRIVKSWMTTSAAAAILTCGGHAASAQDATKPSTPMAPGAPSISSDGISQSSSAPEEVVVTGTNIKGVKPIAPVITITREDIERSGYADIADVMHSLPENFADGQNPGVIAADRASLNNVNATYGSTVDLFGLGADATLTLINGHRMPSDGSISAADISVIPLGAIQRVEVVTDGSSAIYGSDAVAGVVNFILRKDYNGLEASAYYGGATDGGDETQIYSVLGGIVRDHWHLLVSAEYEHQDPITASQRDYTSGYYGAGDLIGAQTRRTIFASGGIDFTDKISFSLDALYNDREAGQEQGLFPFDYFEPKATGYFENLQYHTPNANVAATLEFQLPRGWNLRFVGTEAVSSTVDTSQEVELGQNIYSGNTTYRNTVSSAEVIASGTALTLPTGDVRLAFGGGYRRERFGLTYPGEPTDDAYVQHAARDVTYVYGEGLIPLVPASADRLGLESLELSASGRYEHYSDFGDTVNPRVGISYVPLGGLTIRTTWGTSFKAPTFYQMHEANEVTYYTASYYGGQGNALFVYGGNPDLKPERSDSWTFGAEYKPPELPSLVLSATYFHIDYTDRIVEPFTNANSTDFISNPANSSFITSNPSSALDESIIASAVPFLNELGTPVDTSTIHSIINNIYQNAEAQVDTGVDVSYRESFKLGVGEIRTFANAIWTHLTQQLVAGGSSQTLSGTAYNVPSFRARGGASWSKYGFTVTAFLNYTNGETNNLVSPSQKVSSWTTVDANITYRFLDNNGLRKGLSCTLSATNLFDKAPPYVSGEITYSGLNYDSLNASAVGRFVALKVTKKW